MSELPPPVDTYDPTAADYAANLDAGIRQLGVLRRELRAQYEEATSTEGLSEFLIERGVDFKETPVFSQRIPGAEARVFVVEGENNEVFDGIQALILEYESGRTDETSAAAHRVDEARERGREYASAISDLTEIVQVSDAEQPQGLHAVFIRGGTLHHYSINFADREVITGELTYSGGATPDELRAVGIEGTVYEARNPSSEIPSDVVIDRAVATHFTRYMGEKAVQAIELGDEEVRGIAETTALILRHALERAGGQALVMDAR